MKTLLLSLLLLLIFLCEGYTRIFKSSTTILPSSSSASSSYSTLSLFSSLFSSQSLLSSTFLCSSSNVNIDTTNDKTSVHLQLTGKLDHRLDDTNNTESNATQSNDNSNSNKSKKHMVPLLEFFNDHDNKTVIASAESIGLYELELFSMYLFNHNYSIKTGISLRERIIDTREKEHADYLMKLWQSERLLGASRNFPGNLISGEDKNTFKAVFMTHVKRIKSVKEGLKNGDEIIYSFIKNQNISGMNWDHYIFNPNDNKETMLKTIKDFAIWFKQQFPYYYDNCLNCGNVRSNIWFGSVYPSNMERTYLAGKTELYSCIKCNRTSRFPRFNEVTKVLETRTGRCGEYSILMFRMLKVLGYNVRYIADWADHVWIEALVHNDWIHIDPCEAAVNEPLIYQGWGKNQTYIFAFSFNDTDDVTKFYTTNYEASLIRRKEDNVDDNIIQETLKEANEILRREIMI